jgi:glycogen debranching enzyme
MDEAVPLLPDTTGPAHASEPPPASALFALKEGDAFIVCDQLGDISGEADGFFHFDTRLLSKFQLSFGNVRPSLLSSAVSRDNVYFTVNITNRPLPVLGGYSTPQGVLHLERARFLWQERIYERVRCTNYSSQEAIVPLTFSFGADFADMFEVRGKSRPFRGKLYPPEVNACGVLFRYHGLDGVMRNSSISFSEQPRELTASHATYLVRLAPDRSVELYLEIGATLSEPTRYRFRHNAAKARWAMRKRMRRGARVFSGGRLFNEWIEKSRADLALLTTELPTGPYPYAGIPWFSTAFGRDAIISALQTLWIDTSLARGVLAYLASTQAQETSAFQDSEPGKIMHETRKGEMTALKEVPFARYYGGVDTTPLFVGLAGAYAARTGDLAFITSLWPALTAAMGWIESVTKLSTEGFLTYARGAKSGLVNQSWKDSDDSVFHANGRIPRGPIASVEVQGYVYSAYRAMASLSRRRGESAGARHYKHLAERMRENVESHFWMEEEGFYAIAIDGEGEQCRVRGSNPGHLLYSGLPSRRRAVKVVQSLTSPSFDTGWGLRTLAPGQARYNPMSYHNGSVWPHDTCLCVAGLARYGERQGVVRLFNQMFETAVSFGMRLPELFCGFPRRPGEPPIAYPVACLPQAWAAGSFFMLLQSCLGLTVDGWRGEIHIDRPRLPIGIDHIEIHGLMVGDKVANLGFQRVDNRIVTYSNAASRIPLVIRV